MQHYYYSYHPRKVGMAAIAHHLPWKQVYQRYLDRFHVCQLRNFLPSFYSARSIAEFWNPLKRCYQMTLSDLSQLNRIPNSVIITEESQLNPSTIADAVVFIKRTFQPSLIRRKRKHGSFVVV